MSVPTPSGHRLETDYDHRRLRQWLAGEAKADGVTRRRLLTLLAATAAGTAFVSPRSARAAVAGIVTSPRARSETSSSDRTSLSGPSGRHPRRVRISRGGGTGSTNKPSTPAHFPQSCSTPSSSS
ncbi:hypothetical protein [Streptomyces sp. NPDC003015]